MTRSVMRDLRSTRWIIAKGVAFLGIAVLTATSILIESPAVRTAALLAALVWAACRFYYFLFYVLERYVDPTGRYAGLIALLRAIRGRARAQSGDRHAGTLQRDDTPGPGGDRYHAPGRGRRGPRGA